VRPPFRFFLQKGWETTPGGILCFPTLATEKSRKDGARGVCAGWETVVWCFLVSGCLCWLGDGRLVFSGFWVFVLVERRSSLAVPWWCPPETGPFTEACEGVEFVEASLKG
jgi:hypothetical protein